MPAMAFILNDFELPLDITPFSEGLLGNFPLLGQFPDGFLDHRLARENVVHEARAQADDAALTRALLDLGVVSMLQGELVTAVSHFSEAAEEAKSGSPTLRVLALLCAVHCRAMQYTWSPGGGTLVSEDISRVFDYKKRIPPMQEEIEDAKRRPGYDTRYEAVEISIITQRDLVHARPMTPSSENLALTTRVALPRLEDTFARLANGIQGSLLMGMRIELAWIYRVIGNPSKFLSTLHAVKSKIQNKSALGAHIEMRTGDGYCTSYSNPEIWDTILEQGTESNAQPNDKESLHFIGGGTRNITLARLHYNKAQDVFQELGLLRGIAAIQLRLGYITTIDNSRHDTSADLYKRALEHISFAEDLYSCCGDSIGSQVARAHSCLCRVGIGEETEDRDTARSIGNWGRNTGSYSFAFGLGLFFAKYARRWLVAIGDCERALAAHRLAEALFDGLNAELPLIFSVTDQMAIYEFMGERERFMVTAERALDLCANVSTSTDASTVGKALIHKVQILSRMHLWAQKHADPDDISSTTARLIAVRAQIERMYGSDASTSMEELLIEYQSMSATTLQNILMDHDEQSGADSHAPEIGRLLKMMEGSNLDPLKIQMKGMHVTIGHMVSTANFLVPFYRGRKAAKEGNQAVADILWQQAESSLKEHENEQKDVLLTLLYTDMRMYDKALSHINAYLAKCLTEHYNRSVARTSEARISEETTLMDRSHWQTKLQVLGMFARTRHFQEAGRFLEEIKDQWGSDWWKVYEERVWENLSLVGQINAGLENVELACDYYERAMQAFEERRDQLSIDDYKIALAGDSKVQEIYFGAAHSAVKLHLKSPETTTARGLNAHLQRAFVDLERGKARSLLDLIGCSSLSSTSSSSQPRDQWSEYKQQMALLTTRRALLANAYSSQNPSDPSYITRLKSDVVAREQQIWATAKSLERSGQSRMAPMIATEVIDLPEICSILAEDTAILQYSYQHNDLIAWLITKLGMVEVHHIKVSEAKLEKSIHEFHRACEGATGDAESLASWLGKTLLPFNSLRYHARLIIVAYRALHLVPFHALLFRQKLLSDNHALSYLPSVSLLKHLSGWKKLESSSSVLAIGDPSNMVYKDPLTGLEEDMHSLPGSALEAKEIAKVVPGSMALVAGAATSEAVYSRMSEYSILHFGAHCSLCPAIPMLSVIHLAGGTQITVDQLMGTRLNAELVVLSACDTGRGRVTEGEDVIGFARALLAAGVKHIIVSLWPVDDLATCYLMVQMYKNIIRGMPIAEALCDAQAKLRGSEKGEIDAYLDDLRTRKERLHSQLEESLDRDYSQGNRQTAKVYSHPKFWAPFVLIGT